MTSFKVWTLGQSRSYAKTLPQKGAFQETAYSKYRKLPMYLLTILFAEFVIADDAMKSLFIHLKC